MVRDPRRVDVHPISHPRGCRSYVVSDPASREAALVDPLLDHLKETLDALKGLELRWIVETHSHGDHLSGAAALARRMGAEVVAHPAYPGEVPTLRAADGERLALGEQALVVRHAPGVSADALIVSAPGALFTGDTLLIGTVGLRDAPGSDPEAWYDTLRRLFAGLSDETVIHPGHDDMGRAYSTLRQERTGNRWLREDDRDAFLKLYAGDDRAPRRDAPRILAANAQGLLALPGDLDSASGLEAPARSAERASARAARTPPEKEPPPMAPRELAGGLLVALGLAVAGGTVAGWLVHPGLHAVSLLAALVLLAVGLPNLEAARRRRSGGEPGLYYQGPTRIGIGD